MVRKANLLKWSKLTGRTDTRGVSRSALKYQQLHNLWLCQCSKSPVWLTLLAEDVKEGRWLPSLMAKRQHKLTRGGIVFEIRILEDLLINRS